MYDTQKEYDADMFIENAFCKKPTFKERCLTCLHVRFDKDVKDTLCSADNFKTCLSVEIECEMEKIECQMFEEMKDDK